MAASSSPEITSIGWPKIWFALAINSPALVAVRRVAVPTIRIFSAGISCSRSAKRLRQSHPLCIASKLKALCSSRPAARRTLRLIFAIVCTLPSI
ncbi:Uncharacterised protein [Vibrio cholerae]|nr:Uncharacterised protein [Vibrio cholerae]CSC71955.1 Uncharacterised protein [Vibrio cholerae]CSD36426.1 Uncharacterised protein [Vibrio cholerae]CSH86642.1 Uncharacterised protein [Vibrio cholerae]